MADGVRVVTRTLKRLETLVGRGRRAVRDRSRSVTRRLLEILYAARSPKTHDRLVHSYRRLLGTTRAVVREAATMTRRIGHRRREADAATRRQITRLQTRLRTTLPLVHRVIA